MSDVVQKLWGFCHTLRHGGIDYGDSIEQITYLLFLKMADERGIDIPKECDWPTLRDYTGTELTDHYIDILRKLGKAPGLLSATAARGGGRLAAGLSPRQAQRSTCLGRMRFPNCRSEDRPLERQMPGLSFYPKDHPGLSHHGWAERINERGCQLLASCTNPCN
jgi:hypothetical protein